MDAPDEAVKERSFSVDATLAGRAYQTMEVQPQDNDGHDPLLWVPMPVGNDRLGVLEVGLSNADGLAEDTVLREALTTLAQVVAQLMATKLPYSDEIVRLRQGARAAGTCGGVPTPAGHPRVPPRSNVCGVHPPSTKQRSPMLAVTINPNATPARHCPAGPPDRWAAHLGAAGLRRRRPDRRRHLGVRVPRRPFRVCAAGPQHGARRRRWRADRRARRRGRERRLRRDGPLRLALADAQSAGVHRLIPALPPRSFNSRTPGQSRT